jgi:hypothetical protein
LLTYFVRLQWLASRFAAEAQQSALPCLLELLLLLPQESRGYPSMFPDQRRRFLQSLLAATADAFSLLVSCMQVKGSQGGVLWGVLGVQMQSLLAATADAFSLLVPCMQVGGSLRVKFDLAERFNRTLTLPRNPGSNFIRVVAED